MIYDIVRDAQGAARIAAEKKYAELVAAGPKYEVYNADIAGEKKGPAVGTMLDVCGFATCYIPVSQMSRRLPEVKLLITQKILGYDDYRKACYIYTGGNRQEMSVNEAAAHAACEVMRNNGYGKAYVESRID